MKLQLNLLFLLLLMILVNLCHCQSSNNPTSTTEKSKSSTNDDSTEIDLTTVESVDKDLPTSLSNFTDESTLVPVTNLPPSSNLTTPTPDSISKNEETVTEDEDYDDDSVDDETSTKENTDDANDEEKNVEEDSDYYNEEGNEETTDEEEEEEEYEEERCTLKNFLSTMNITEMFPQDRDNLTKEYQSFEEDPKQMLIAPSVNFTFQRINRLLNLARNIASQQELRSGITNFLHHNFDLFLELDLGSNCINSIISILVAIRRSDLWALKFFDSAPKLPPGILTGVGSYLGNFDQCISIDSPESSSESWSGQYCIIKPVLPLPETKATYSDESVIQSDEKLTEQRDKILNFYSHYNVDQYLKTNPVLKFVEIMKSNKGRVTNFAICLPDVCSAGQLEIALNKFLYPIIGIPLEIQESSCWTKAKTKDYSLYMDAYAQFALVVIGILSLLVMATTIYELYPWIMNDGNINYHHTQHHDMAKIKSKLMAGQHPAVATLSPSTTLPSSSATSQCSSPLSITKSLVSIFSALGNSRQLLMTPSCYDDRRRRLMVFDTLRLIIVILIGLTNAFYNKPLSPALHNISQSVPHELLSDPKYFFIRAPSLLNDGLLIIAGALFVRSIFRHLIKPHDTFTYLMYFIRRWIRLTMPVFGSILFIYLLPSTGYGPLWYRMIEILMPACHSPSSLASTLFHYSNWNFIKSNYTNDNAYVVCNPDTWFISIVFQLNVAFFMIVLLMYQSPKKGLRILIIFIIASVLLNISPRLFFSNTRTYYELVKQPSLWHARRSFYLYHQNILQYIGSFSVGLLLGYAIIVNENVTKDPKSNPNKHMKKTMLYNLIAFLGIIGPWFWVNQFFIQNQAPNEVSVLLFFSVGRFIFSLSFAWIIYVCVSKKSLLLYYLLTPTSIQPIAKLSFAIFLIQPLVQYHRMYSVKETYVMTFRNTIEHYVCDLLISIFFSYILYLLFEAPACRLNTMFFGRRPSNDNEDCFDSDDGSNATAIVDNTRSYWCNEHPSDEKEIKYENKNQNVEKQKPIAMDNKDGDYEQNGVISIRF